MAWRFIDRMRTCKIGKTRFFFLPELIAVFIVAPVAFMTLDRTPPLKLHSGRMLPDVVYQGQRGVEVQWRAHYAGRDCPGISQREIIDSKNNLWPKMARSRRGIFKADADNPLEGDVITPQLSIPPQIEPGKAQYRVTQFYFCNALQRWLDWPIIEVSPSINFEVMAP